MWQTHRSSAVAAQIEKRRYWKNKRRSYGRIAFQRVKVWCRRRRNGGVIPHRYGIARGGDERAERAERSGPASRRRLIPRCEPRRAKRAEERKREGKEEKWKRGDCLAAFSAVPTSSGEREFSAPLIFQSLTVGTANLSSSSPSPFSPPRLSPSRRAQT